MEIREKLIEETVTQVKLNSSKLTWKEVNVMAGDKPLLCGVSGSVHSGQSLAIIGPSGSGKTTLLNFLAKKGASPGIKQTGNVYFNSELITSAHRHRLMISYVMQDDVLDDNLTALEILMFTAKLRMSQSLLEIEEKVNLIIIQLGLEKCKNTIVGGLMSKGVSGGEKRRISIASELLNDSPVLILDEPTSGLDSQTAFELVSTLNELKNSGKIIIFTIHQPSSEIYDLLNQILILAKGQKIFMNDKSELIPFFSKINLPIPQYYNQFEYILEITSTSAVYSNNVVEAYPELVLIINQEEAYSHYISLLCTNNFSMSESIELKYEDGQLFSNSNSSFFTQIYFLVLKFLIIGFRNPKHFRFKMIQYIILGVVKAFLFFQLSYDEVGTRSMLGFLMYTAISIVFNATSSAVLICKHFLMYLVAEDRKVFVKDRSNGLYSTTAYYLAKLASTIPGLVLASCLYSIIVYYAIGLNQIFGFKFYYFLLLVTLGSFVATIYATFIASLTSDPKILASLTMVNI